MAQELKATEYIVLVGGSIVGVELSGEIKGEYLEIRVDGCRWLQSDNLDCLTAR